MQLLFCSNHPMVIYLLFFAMLVFLPLFLFTSFCKCCNVFRFRASVRRCTFSFDCRSLLSSTHASGLCKRDTFWIFPFAPLRSAARLILAILLRSSNVHPFLLYPFS